MMRFVELFQTRRLSIALPVSWYSAETVALSYGKCHNTQALNANSHLICQLALSVADISCITPLSIDFHTLVEELLGRKARVVDHLAVKNVVQGAPLGGGSTLHFAILGGQDKNDEELTFPLLFL